MGVETAPKDPVDARRRLWTIQCQPSVQKNPVGTEKEALAQQRGEGKRSAVSVDLPGKPRGIYYVT